MFLTASNIFFYLRDAGLSTSEDVVEGRFSVSETGRRNRNFVVARGDGRSLFIKQIPMRHPELTRSILREAACAQAAASRPGKALLRAMPRLLRYDPACHALVYAYIDGSENLNQRVARQGPLAARLSADLGALLGRCHAETSEPGSLVDIAQVLSGEPPWILGILRRPETIMPNINPARRQLVDVMSECAALRDALDVLSRGWRRICLMHGDVKNDNVLVRIDPGTPDIRLIDWELADLGDPLWDVACSLVAILQPWLLGARMAGRNAALGEAAEQVISAAGAFWSSYRDAAGPVIAWTALEALRLARLVAARFALLGFELLPDGGAAPPSLAHVVPFAAYFASEPLDALERVFGLGASQTSPAGASERPTLRPTP